MGPSLYIVTISPFTFLAYIFTDKVTGLMVIDQYNVGEIACEINGIGIFSIWNRKKTSFLLQHMSFCKYHLDMHHYVCDIFLKHLCASVCVYELFPFTTVVETFRSTATYREQ